MTDFNQMLAKLQKNCLNSFQGLYEKQTYVRVALTLKIEKALAKSLIRQLTELGLLEATTDPMVYQPTAAGRMVQLAKAPDAVDDDLNMQVMQSILTHKHQSASVVYVANQLNMLNKKDHVSRFMRDMAEAGQLIRYPNNTYRVGHQWRHKILGQSAGGVQ